MPKKASKKKQSAVLGGKNSKATKLTEKQRKALMYGNSYWMKRSSHGRKPIFKKPADLLDAGLQYCKHVEDNPLKEEKVFCYQGEVTKTTINKMRAMTEEGLCTYIGISLETWRKYKLKPDFVAVCKQIQTIFYEQKLTGASADLLNASIIARHLGLKDRTDLSSDDGSMSPKTVRELSEEELKEELAKYGIKQ